MRGTREVTLFALPLPPRSRVKSRERGTAAAAVTGDDQLLFEKLRNLRRRIAHERGVPPYLIFGDRSLAAMSAQRPRSEAEFLQVIGVGQHKARDLGPAFLAAIRAHLEGSSAAAGG
jgi:ATP-dependent DNA helicase RecQ